MIPFSIGYFMIALFLYMNIVSCKEAASKDLKWRATQIVMWAIFSILWPIMLVLCIWDRRDPEMIDRVFDRLEKRCCRTNKKGE